MSDKFPIPEPDDLPQLAPHQSVRMTSAATDEVPDPEPWDDAEGEPRSGDLGVMPSTFPDRGVPRFPIPPYPADDGPDPVAVIVPAPVEVYRPRGLVIGTMTLDQNVAMVVAPDSPGRFELRVRNRDQSETVRLAPSEGQALSSAASLLLGPGEIWETSSTAEIWGTGVAGPAQIEVTQTIRGEVRR